MLRIVCCFFIRTSRYLSSMINDDLQKKFGDKIKKLRNNCGLSQEELAHKSGLHRTQISLIENGQRCPRLDTIYKLASALQVRPEKLLPDCK
ncbi:MAG: helix-turn-helix transcriptional regulator [Sedimentisphaerales bacterium]